MSRPALLVLGALGVLLYLRSPIDVVPDRIFPLGLLDDLVVLGLAAWWIRRRLAARASIRRAEPGTDRAWSRETPFDAWTVLGLAPGASPEAVTQAYRAQMKRYHPDRVADLGPELQEVAHRKALEIQRAYEELSRR